MRLIDRPVFVIGCNRSGTTLLFRTLGQHPDTWSYYDESQHVYYEYYPVDAELGDRIVDSPGPEIATAIVRRLYAEAHNKEYFKDRRVLRFVPRKALQRQVNQLYKRAPVRLLEKTPANCFRIPFLAALFPDARFIFLIRRAEEVISSLMEGWKHWSDSESRPWVFSRWHYLVPPGWQAWTGRRLEEICAFQWIESVGHASRDLKALGADRFLLVKYGDILKRPQELYAKVLDFCELPSSSFFDAQMRRERSVLHTQGGSAPAPKKWETLHLHEIESVRHMFADLQRKLYPDDD